MRRRTQQHLLIAGLLVAVAGVGTLAAPYLQPNAAAGEGGSFAPSTSTSTPTGAAPSTSSTVAASAVADALQDLHALPLSDAYVPGYDRHAFGQTWGDTDRNGCDTRNDVLRRDLTAVVTKPGTNGCVVLSGTLHDPYTGRTIAFQRGETSSLAVQIDHRVPLAYAWRHGAASWTAEQRELFANDQAGNLVAVDGPANEAKSDSGPAEWMPADTADACSYATAFVAVTTKWRLTIGTADAQALDRTLADCAKVAS